MALTRVSRHIIDEPLELQNINATGIGTFASLRVTGDLQVDGTTTTLDTVVTEVDRLEVAANNSTVGAAITQTGSGDILRLFDGASQKVTIDDEGNIGVGAGADTPHAPLHIRTGTTGAITTLLKLHGPFTSNTGSEGTSIDFGTAADTSIGARIIGTREAAGAKGALRFCTGRESDSGFNDGRMVIDETGRVGVGEDNVQAHFHVAKNIADSDAINWTGSQLSVATPIAGNNTANRATIYFAPYGSDNNYAPSAISASAGTSGASTLKFFTNASGNLTGQVQNYERLRITSGGQVRVPDGGKFTCGASDDLEVYHNGNDSAINDKGTGNFYIQGSSNIYIRDYDTSESHIIMTKNGSVQLYHDGSKKLETASTGIQVTGQVNASTMHLTDGNGIHIGNSNDLRVYHNGTHSYIDNVTNGALIIRNTSNDVDVVIESDDGSGGLANYFRADGSTGDAILYHYGAQRLHTTSTGINVVGTINADGLDIDDNAYIKIGTGDDLRIFHDGSNNYIQGNNGSIILKNSTGDYFVGNVSNGAAEVYYNNSKKLETTTTGAKVTGALEVTQEYPSIRPTLDLNFAATKTLDRRITFTRDSIGTYVDENGLVKYASNNVPRFDHDPTTGESLGLLIEESRTNYVDNSNDVSQWNRIINSATIESNTTDTLSPDGTNTSTKITGGSNSGISRDGVLSVSASTNYIASIFAKKGTADSFKLEFGTGANQFQATFNLTTKAFSGTSAGGWFTSISTSYVDYPNGWVRVILTGTTGGSASGSPNFAVYGISSGYAYFWGGQAEVGSFVTSLIPTHGSTVTRAADNAKITGTNFTDFYNDTEGTFFVEADTINPTYNTGITGFDGSNNNYTIVGTGDSPNRFQLRFDDQEPFQVLGFGPNSTTAITSNTTLTPTLRAKIAGAFKQDDVRGAAQGEIILTDTSFDMISPTSLFIGSLNGSSEILPGHVRKVSYYRQALPNAQLQGLTQQ